MKRIVMLISVMAVSMSFSAITILAADNSPMSFEKYVSLLSSHVKNECLLVAKNCATKSSTVQERVNDLRNEIAKGFKAYTPTELNILKEQLKWIESDNNDFI
jgi:hypothetical protein